MASYPSALAQDASSREEWRDPIEISYARSGALKARRTQSARKRIFYVEHKCLTDTEKGTLATFYDTNRATTLTFAWNFATGTTYTCVFADDTLQFKRTPGQYWDVSVKLAEV